MHSLNDSALPNVNNRCVIIEQQCYLIKFDKNSLLYPQSYDMYGLLSALQLR